MGLGLGVGVAVGLVLSGNRMSQIKPIRISTMKIRISMCYSQDCRNLGGKNHRYTDIMNDAIIATSIPVMVLPNR